MSSSVLHSIIEWVTAADVEEVFSMSKSALRVYTYRYKIPTKREYGCTYYSKEHLEEQRRTDLMNDDNYYTTEQVQQLYGLTSANICKTVSLRTRKIKDGRMLSYCLDYYPGYRQRALRLLRQGEDEGGFPCLLQETGGQEELQVAARLYAFPYLHTRQGTFGEVNVDLCN